jgi:hypothetical protein
VAIGTLTTARMRQLFFERELEEVIRRRMAIPWADSAGITAMSKV